MSKDNGPMQKLPEGPRSDRPGGPNLKLSRNLLSWMILMGTAMVLLVYLQSRYPSPEPITLSKFYTYVDDGQIERLIINHGEGKLEGWRKRTGADPAGTEPVRFVVNYPQGAMDSEFLRELRDKLPKADIKEEKPNPYLVMLLQFLPWLILFAFIWFFIFRQIRNVGTGGGMLGSFGRSRHRVSTKEHTNITFADVAGIEEAKDEVQEIVEFLKSPKKFQRLGGRIPRGVLLIGEPGCGKTLLAKAIAGEADVPFLSISGSDFVEMFVGVGASRVRDLFKQAKDSAPCIIFLDEIDAVGRRRGMGFGGGGHDEREQTLNAILVEMDGFDTNDQVIVIAATNRADVLDPALIRPGRFDRQVYVPLPDVKGRYEILKVHTRKVKLGPNVDLKRVARGTAGFSGAELAALVNEGAIIAAMADKDYIEHEDLEEARDKVRWGRSKRSRIIDESEKKATAYHEAGHALVQALEKNADPLHKVSIVPRGPYGGATFSLPERDRTTYGLKYLQSMLRVCCAGRIAEERFTGDINSGAMGDIRQATSIARKMVAEWGMNRRLGFVAYSDEGRGGFFAEWPGSRDYADDTAKAIDEEVQKLVDEAYKQTEAVLQQHDDKVRAIAEALLKFETLTGDEVHAIIRGETLDRATVTDLLDDPGAMPKPVGVARPVKAEPKSGPDLGQGPLPQPSS
ncbi:MAG: ATP-dependent zinc metalloprotease FtsH [Phycisphaerae bacterium]|nr:MAG: ATP-dependent metallopeptidase FtsH/Yme1/Tma family protein [Planctomycetota bacterium]KAB2949191.1 MAG: ATP-dependent zinc metalloprotease FtsH [Phycisphaerae bacterium]MBE7458707.1 ATP-dependent zinc metalloprotease FtsH [Planctomycetia bacterium]MCK6466029.1 ATP-dependent zinc metalloprotease FtsH [Phycisphaerae bacterium]MCL4719757.1 ATP-dependent zinc metalloprotease FtsH [Phycisphaerae bacterium]